VEQKSEKRDNRDNGRTNRLLTGEGQTRTRVTPVKLTEETCWAGTGEQERGSKIYSCATEIHSEPGALKKKQTITCTGSGVDKD